MPKKKLTKAQVKRKLKSVNNGIYDMILDKMGHSDSSVPASIPALLEMQKKIMAMRRRIAKP